MNRSLLQFIVIAWMSVAGFDAMSQTTAFTYQGRLTENGSAEIRGLGLDARAEALIAIAAPEHRPALAHAWQGMRAAL